MMRRVHLGLSATVIAVAAACGSRTGLDGPSSCESSASDAGPVVATSCQGAGDGLTNCGATSESCCTSLEVTGGTYYRTYTNTGSGPTGEADPATVSTFRLDKYEVTVGRFRRFVAAWNAGWLPAAGSGKHTHLNCGQGLVNGDGSDTYESGWITADNGKIRPSTNNLTKGCDNPSYATWTITVGNNETKPINCVNWYEAYAFCIWDGGFLPSEAEWEYAAAGGSQEREYPWGSTQPGTTNQYAIYDCYYPNEVGPGSCTGMANFAPVGTARLGGGLWGQLDLAGNTWEWNLDYNSIPYANPCTNCAGLTDTHWRVIRGGSYGVTTSNLLASFRGAIDSAPPHSAVGFRCARTP